MTTRRILTTLTPFLAVAVSITAWADDPPPPPNGVWLGKGQFGFLDSRGNSDAESLNANLDLSRYDGPWKNEIYFGGLYGKSSGVLSAERWELHEQTNYNLSPRLFWFGGLRFEHDMFDGFVYQGSVTSGLGYKFIATDATTLTAQAGAGYRRLRPELIDKDADGVVTDRTYLDESSAGIGTVSVDFSHKFNASTTLTNKFLTEIGAGNKSYQDNIALAVKMTTKLALSVGYGIMDNSNPPAGLKKVDTVTTVNLQYSF